MTLREVLRFSCIAFFVCAAWSAVAIAADETPTGENPESTGVLTDTIRGRVVWMAAALAKRGIKTVPEAADRVLALETASGDLHPLVEDIRGRAFRRDERLRKVDLELFVRKHRGSPMVQVVRAYELRKDDKLELDYWCDICAIAMFELKECDCCQGPIELRKRLVK